MTMGFSTEFCLIMSNMLGQRRQQQQQQICKQFGMLFLHDFRMNRAFLVCMSIEKAWELFRGLYACIPDGGFKTTYSLRPERSIVC